MESRFNQQKANLRTFLRKRGAVIDVKRRTIKVDTETLNRKEIEKLEELERWGYEVNKEKQLPPLLFRDVESVDVNEGDSFVEFADEIMRMFY